jgi:hypothetical protein
MKQKSRHEEIKLIHTLNILHSHAGKEESMYRSARKEARAAAFHFRFQRHKE